MAWTVSRGAVSQAALQEASSLGLAIAPLQEALKPGTVSLDLLTGAVQAYIFAVLATVFIGAAVGEGGGQGRLAGQPEAAGGAGDPDLRG